MARPLSQLTPNDFASLQAPIWIRHLGTRRLACLASAEEVIGLSCIPEGDDWTLADDTLTAERFLVGLRKPRAFPQLDPSPAPG